jgi:hypothetical protein
MIWARSETDNMLAVGTLSPDISYCRELLGEDGLLYESVKLTHDASCRVWYNSPQYYWHCLSASGSQGCSAGCSAS